MTTNGESPQNLEVAPTVSATAIAGTDGPVDEKTTRANIHRVVFSDPAQPASPLRILMVHGTMDRSTSFRRAARYLQEFEVASYDRRGYGLSVVHDTDFVPPKVSFQEHLDDLVEIVREKPTVIFGHSYGGTLSLLAAGQKLENLAGMVVFECPLQWYPGWSKRWPWSEDDPDMPIDPAWASAQAESFMVEMIGESNWRRLPPTTKAQRRMEGITMVSEMRSMTHLSAPFQTKNIDIPVIVARSKDAPSRHVEAARFLLEHLPMATYAEIEGTGHGVHLHKPQEVARLMRMLMDLVRYRDKSPSRDIGIPAPKGEKHSS